MNRDVLSLNNLFQIAENNDSTFMLLYSSHTLQLRALLANFSEA
jgi:hypothetical protein